VDGRTHNAVTLAATVPTFAVATYLTRDPGLGALAAAGCLTNTVMGPDLDHEKVTENELVLWRVSPVVGVPYSLMWLPYSHLPHRSPLSHWPVVGTLGRLLYVAAWLLLAQLLLGVDAFWFLAYPKSVAAYCAGLALADGLHWLWDGCPV